MDSYAQPFQWVTTTSALLEALRTPENETIWLGFDQRYRGIVERVALRLGLPPEDAGDVAQQTMLEFARDYQAGKYQRERGSLGGWLIGIARHRALDALRARQRRTERGSSALPEAPAEDLRAIWEQEQTAEIMQRAIAHLRKHTQIQPQTLEVFEQVALHGREPEAVAAAAGIEVAAVYRIKHRLTSKLREAFAEIAREYE